MATDLPPGRAFDGGLAAFQAAAENHPGLPPVAHWHPPHCGDSLIRIARDGTWTHQGDPIRRAALVRLFSTLLRKDDEGFMLVTPAEKLSVTVEDAPFVAVLMTADGENEDQVLSFTTNVGDSITAGPEHGLRFAPDPRSGAPIPYIHVRQGLEARLARPVYYHLVERAVVRGTDLGVWSGGSFFILGPAL
ncbi:MAG TPA: DUF1285 domain-containing protein [Rhizomicrobium sp.]|jgi:hypothetical protein